MNPYDFADAVAKASGWTQRPDTQKACSECGSINVFYDAYVGVNDPDDVRTFDQAFCDDCEGETSLVDKEN